MAIYAMYKGEKCLSIGTIYQIAKELNVQVDTVKFYLTPTYKQRLSKRKKGRFENQRCLVRLDDEESEIITN